MNGLWPPSLQKLCADAPARVHGRDGGCYTRLPNHRRGVSAAEANLRMLVLAHRGWWSDPQDRNTRAAFAKAFAAGYGIETDVRDSAGRLVISHDPPFVGEDLMSFDALLALRATAEP